MKCDNCGNIEFTDVNVDYVQLIDYKTNERSRIFVLDSACLCEHCGILLCKLSKYFNEESDV